MQHFEVRMMRKGMSQAAVVASARAGDAGCGGGDGDGGDGGGCGGCSSGSRKCLALTVLAAPTRFAR
jgi:hypothetical protein